MEPQRRLDIERIYSKAILLSPQMRVAYLNESCGPDDNLRREVESLLAQSSQQTETPAETPLPSTKLQAGSRLGPYQIEAKVGEGGMGEVWKALDTRVNRIVAIKVSKAGFSERFEREAHAVAAMNHPHICQLYDVGPNYLVMEYVEGIPLKGPLKLDKVFAYADQILDALSAAHRKGIVHRDLKPANILITATGIKLLDFGLAKQSVKFQDDSRTGSYEMTGAGQIIGTLQYMSPEQLRGNEIDARSDLFAFGSVLYELIGGTPAFAGGNPANTIAEILEREPKPLPIPADLNRVLKTCLAKDPAQRFQTAVDLRRNLAWAHQPVSETTVPRGVNRWQMPALVLLGLAFAALAILHFNEGSREAPIENWVMPQPAKGPLLAAQLSPDASQTVFVIVDPDRGPQLWIRSRDGLQNRVLAGTEGASDPFWSPDNRYVGFFADGKLKKVAVAKGAAPPTTLSPAVNTFGGTWNKADIIVFSISSYGLQSVSAASGGTPTLVVPEERAGYPKFLTDGRRLLYVRRQPASAGGGTYLHDPDKTGGDMDQLLMEYNQGPVEYAPPLLNSRVGHLLFWRDTNLIALPVNPETLAVAGDMIVVADGPTKGVASAALFSVSSNGVLAYAGGKGERQLTWYDRNGNPLSRVGESSEFGIFRLSEDDKHLVIERQARSSSRATDLYILEMDKIGTGLGRRFTTEAKEVKKAPVFSSDGRSVIYNDDDGKDGTVIRRKMVNGTGATEILYASTAGQNPSGFSSKGPYLIFTLLNPSNDVMALRVESGNQEQPIILAQGFSKNQKHSNDRFGTVSRDGKWLAYDSDESGRFEVYVRPFLLANATQPGNAKTTGGRKVSVDGGTQAIWRGDGTELFYVVPQTGLLMSVSITMIGDELVPGSPETLFRIHANTGSGGVNWFAASSDGLKFLVAEPPEESTALTVLTNWQAVAGKMSVQ